MQRKGTPLPLVGQYETTTDWVPRAPYLWWDSTRHPQPWCRGPFTSGGTVRDSHRKGAAGPLPLVGQYETAADWVPWAPYLWWDSTRQPRTGYCGPLTSGGTVRDSHRKGAAGPLPLVGQYETATDWVLRAPYLWWDSMRQPQPGCRGPLTSGGTARDSHRLGAAGPLPLVGQYETATDRVLRAPYLWWDSTRQPQIGCFGPLTSGGTVRDSHGLGAAGPLPLVGQYETATDWVPRAPYLWWDSTRQPRTGCHGPLTSGGTVRDSHSLGAVGPLPLAGQRVGLVGRLLLQGGGQASQALRTALHCGKEAKFMNGGKREVEETQHIDTTAEAGPLWALNVLFKEPSPVTMSWSLSDSI
ncbi:hypothetical protein NDU88_011167 [Pleurodeles waltl]|uniref:Uncharacterized protein n=1 Tax=Pleurodeles waltl TaxID=8319 RepID=A0AAV7PZZ9_PLEWA|nr:hypothetical protein NDU88_011167 [Pleurodeles waltl]